MCGLKIFLAVMFGEMDLDDYYDNISEWKRKDYQRRVEECDGKLKNIMYLGDSDAINLKVSTVSVCHC